MNTVWALQELVDSADTEKKAAVGVHCVNRGTGHTSGLAVWALQELATLTAGTGFLTGFGSSRSLLCHRPGTVGCKGNTLVA